MQRGACRAPVAPRSARTVSKERPARPRVLLVPEYQYCASGCRCWRGASASCPAVGPPIAQGLQARTD
eukprot:7276930-Lingulodinium_polyedra.AAC.1